MKKQILFFLFLSIASVCFSQNQITTYTTYNTGQSIGSNTIADITQNPLTNDIWFTGPNEIFYLNQDTFRQYSFLHNFYQTLELFVDINQDGHICFFYNDSLYVQFQDSINSIAIGSGNSQCNDLICDSQGNVWIASSTGLYRFNGNNIDYFGISDGLGSSGVRTVFEDSQGTIWVGDNNGVADFNGSGFNHYPIQWTTNNKGVSTIGQDSNGTIWVGGLSIAFFNGSSWNILDIATLLGSVSPIQYVNCINVDNQGKLWFGTGADGLFYKDGNAWTHQTESDGLPNNHIKCSYRDHQGKLWFGFNSGGLATLFNGNWSYFSTNNALADNIVYDIHADSESNIWFATYNGISKFDSNWSTYLSHYNSQAAKAIKSDMQGRVCVKADNIYRYFGNVLDTVYTNQETGAIDFISTGLEEYWISNMSGVQRCQGPDYNLLQNWDYFYPSDGLPDIASVAIEKDSSNRIWVGTYGGPAIYNGSGFDPIVIPSDDFGPGILDIRTDLLGNIWFASFNGAAMFDGANWDFYTTTQGLVNNYVEKIEIASDSTIWFSTWGGISVKTDTGFYSLTKMDGLVHDHIHCLEQDYIGNMWVGTHHGVNKIHNAVLADTTGLNTASRSQFYFNIFPNPATSSITIRSNKGMNGLTLEISTITGQLKIAKEVSSNIENIAISELEPGTYIIRLYSKQTSSARKLVVLN